jgi:hypothetical protein
MANKNVLSQSLPVMNDISHSFLVISLSFLGHFSLNIENVHIAIMLALVHELQILFAHILQITDVFLFNWLLT